MDTFSDNEAICPYCGHEHKINWDWFEGEDLECEVTVECDNCEKEFTLQRSAIIMYETFRLED